LKANIRLSLYLEDEKRKIKDEKHTETVKLHITYTIVYTGDTKPIHSKSAANKLKL
jgi:hypothetical protein